MLTIVIKHGFPCINIRQVPREVLKTKAGGRGFQHLPRDLANVNALKKPCSIAIIAQKTENICYISRYSRSRAGHYTSRDGSNSVAPVKAY